VEDVIDDPYNSVPITANDTAHLGNLHSALEDMPHFMYVNYRRSWNLVTMF